MGQSRWTGILLAAAVVAAEAGHAAHAAVFQYRLPVETKNDKGEVKQNDTFLWIPPDSTAIRGVLVAGMTVAERDLVKDPVVRKACAEQGLAIVFLKTGLNSTDVAELLRRYAEASGYAELAVAPMAFVGHSAGGPQARDRAVKFADRCFGLMQYRGGPPWDAAVPAFVPSLMMVGEFDEYGGTMRRADGVEHWEKTMNKLGELRAADPGKLWSMIVEPGAGHFAWSDRNADYFALWIKKAAAARIPARWDAAAAPTLLAVDAGKGWISPLAIKTEKAIEQAGAQGAGKNGGNWHFDKELAEATVAYHHPKTGSSFLLKDQFIKWNDPFWVDAGTRYFFTSPKWVDDGQTLEVHPEYTATYPKTIRGGDGKLQGPHWPDEGKPVGKSSAPIQLKAANGPIVAVGANKVRVKFDNLSPAAEGARFYFMAYSVGDAEHRYTEQVGMSNRGFAGFGGKDQTITFELPAEIASGAAVALEGKSDSGRPVEYYVAYGPAEVVDGKLVVQEVPARAKGPIEIKVVAYQFGSGMKPEVKTAKPVERVIMLKK